MPNKWDIRFLEMAELVASWSKDPSTQCGAVIVRPDKTVASMGFNGFPKGCDDDPSLYENRELKYSRVVHAEMNALLHAREPLNGYTMYTHPKGFGPSCDRCSAHIIQAGITKVVHRGVINDDFASRWKESCERGLQMYKEAGVEVVFISDEDWYVESPTTVMDLSEEVREHATIKPERLMKCMKGGDA